MIEYDPSTSTVSFHHVFPICCKSVAVNSFIVCPDWSWGFDTDVVYRPDRFRHLKLRRELSRSQRHQRSALLPGWQVCVLGYWTLIQRYNVVGPYAILLVVNI